MNKINVACIIDDDPIYVYGVKKMMELVDFSNDILVYRNGHEALSNLKTILSTGEGVPEVIFLDLNMPIVDGWQFLEEFIKVPNHKEITIYIVSSSVDPKDVLRAKAYENVTNYVIKPISSDNIMKIMNDFRSTLH